MQRAADAHEHLDGPLDAAALDGTLRDLGRINRALGGVSLSRRAIAALAGPSSRLHLLDVGTGGADIPVALLAHGDGPIGRVTAIDRRPEIVAWARAAHRGIGGLELVAGDGISLPYGDGSVDIAHASLVLHHLEPAAAGSLLAEMGRVARLGVVINDLDRRSIHWLGAWLLLHGITGNAYTRHDGPQSVRRAYRPAEVLGLAARAGLEQVARHWGPFRHRYAIAFRGAAGGAAGAAGGVAAAAGGAAGGAA